MNRQRRTRFATAIALTAALLFGPLQGGAQVHAAPAVQQFQGWPVIQKINAVTPVTVTEGVTYQTYTFGTADGPIVLHETWVDLTNPNVAVKTVLAHDSLGNKTNETVSAMAGRTGAVAGVNGDYYEQSTTGMALNMSVQEGALLHNPTSSVVLGIDKNNRVTMGNYSFSGVVSAGGETYPLRALNGHPLRYPNGLVLLTPELGITEVAAHATVVTLEKTEQTGVYRVLDVSPQQTLVDAPMEGQVKLLAQGSDAIEFVNESLTANLLLNMTYGTKPSSAGLQYAIGGGPMLIRNGLAYQDPNPPLHDQGQTPDALTAVGVTEDGKRMLQLVVDGRSAESIGLTYAQLTNYLLAEGIANAMLFDSGGSSEMVVRQPGQNVAGVVNHPSDGTERPVANGLFVYSTAQPGLPTNVTLHNGKPLKLFKGTTAPLTAFVTDEYHNPLPDVRVSYRVEPATLGEVTAAGEFVAGLSGGTGKIVATAPNGVQGEIPLTVYQKADSLTLTPNVSDIGNGTKQPFGVKVTAQGQTFTIKPELLKWSVKDASLGSIDAHGVFTADRTNTGSELIIGQFGDVSTTATVGVGFVSKSLDTLSNANLWKITTRWGDVGTLTPSWANPHNAEYASMAANYDFTRGATSKQFVFYPAKTQYIPAVLDSATVNPVGIGVWVYGDKSGLKLAASFERPDHAFMMGANQVTVDWEGWKFVTINLPANATFPLKLDYLDLLVDLSANKLSGTIYLSDLQVLYSARNYLDNQTPVRFADTASHWGRAYIEALARLGIVQGQDASHFAPDRGLTRAEAVAMLVRALDLKPTRTDAFRDVADTAWYAEEVGAAYQAGLVQGVGGGLFRPDAPVDRNQIAVMIYNVLKGKGVAPAATAPILFHDDERIAPWAKAQVDALSSEQMLIGNGEGYLFPDRVTTRAEATKLIYTMMDVVGLL
ncbi:MAG TPA: phosphodiester glycosidase family protein [Bacilli bacterium]|nr:phosphodiester glycosidase family protein [Bacilli bacterium]